MKTPEKKSKKKGRRLNEDLCVNRFEICVPKDCRLFGSWNSAKDWRCYVQKLVGQKLPKEKYPLESCYSCDCKPGWKLTGEWALKHAIKVHEKIHRQVLSLEQVSAVDVGFAVSEQETRFWDFLAIRVHVNKKRSPEQLVRAGLANLTDASNAFRSSPVFDAMVDRTDRIEVESRSQTDFEPFAFLDTFGDYFSPRAGQQHGSGDPAEHKDCGCCGDGNQACDGDCKSCCDRERQQHLWRLLYRELRVGRSRQQKERLLQRYPVGGIQPEDLSVFCHRPIDETCSLEDVRLCICGVPIDIINAQYNPSITHPGGDANSGVFANPPLRSDEHSDDEHLLIGRGRVNPLVGGVSVGSVTGQAGTLGTIVWDRSDSTPCVLSNWHVLAGTPTAQVGQPTYQPAIFDGGTEQDVVANLKRWHLGEKGDAALAELAPTRHYATGEVLGLWHPLSGYVKPKLNLQIRKWGRTTGFTQGFIDGIHLATNIDYGNEVVRYFSNQFHIAPIFAGEDVSQTGDSGSIIVTSFRPQDQQRDLEALLLWILQFCKAESLPNLCKEINEELCKLRKEFCCECCPDAEGKDAEGKDAEGKDAEGKDAEGKDAEGKDAEGKDAEGKDAEGKDAEGKDAEGKDAEGKDAEGKDAEGKDAEGKDAEGKDAEGKDAEGKDAEGKDAEGKDANGGASSSCHKECPECSPTPGESCRGGICGELEDIFDKIGEICAKDDDACCRQSAAKELCDFLSEKCCSEKDGNQANLTNETSDSENLLCKLREKCRKIEGDLSQRLRSKAALEQLREEFARGNLRLPFVKKRLKDLLGCTEDQHEWETCCQKEKAKRERYVFENCKCDCDDIDELCEDCLCRFIEAIYECLKIECRDLECCHALCNRLCLKIEKWRRQSCEIYEAQIWKKKLCEYLVCCEKSRKFDCSCEDSGLDLKKCCTCCEPIGEVWEACDCPECESASENGGTSGQPESEGSDGEDEGGDSTRDNSGSGEEPCCCDGGKSSCCGGIQKLDLLDLLTCRDPSEVLDCIEGITGYRSPVPLILAGIEHKCDSSTAGEESENPAPLGSVVERPEISTIVEQILAEKNLIPEEKLEKKFGSFLTGSRKLEDRFEEFLNKSLSSESVLRSLIQKAIEFHQRDQEDEARTTNRAYYAVGMIFAGDTPGSPFGEFAVASDLEVLSRELRFSLRPVFEPRSSFRELRVRPDTQESIIRAFRSLRGLSPGGAGDDSRGGGPQPDTEPALVDPANRQGGGGG